MSAATDYMPHGMCYLWQADILGLHVVSDALIALAYFSIPFTLVYFVRKRTDLEFTKLFVCFALFIVACGCTHVMDIVTVWMPAYWWSGTIKAITALVSIPTAFLLAQVVPVALRLPSPAALQAANDKLGLEVRERKNAEQEVRSINSTLEARVAQRTAELTAANGGLLREIEQRRRVELELKSTNERFAVAADVAGLGFWDYDVAAQTLRWDETMFRLFGRARRPGDEPYRLWADSLHPDDREVCGQAIRDGLAGISPFDLEFRVVHPGGDIRYLKTASAVMRDKEGRPVQIFGVNFDITERKRAAEQLRLVIEGAPTGMILTDAAGRISLVNAEIERIFGYVRGELYGQSIEVLVPERFRRGHRDLRHGFDANPSARAMGADRDLYGLCNDGSETPVEIGLNPLQTSEGGFVLSTVVDITERRQAVAQLQSLNAELNSQIVARTAQLKEREAMLQEIHHRVKNNLQVISSLINMQVRSITDVPTRRALQECRARVEAMAYIHEMLYQSKDYAHVPFSKYAADLARRIMSASDISTSIVTLRLDMDDVLLPVDRAIPCGLILNELVSNSLKHAFPHGGPGEVLIELKRLPEHRILLAVSDDGVGMPATYDPKAAKSLGVQLIFTLVEQLDADLEMIRRPGTRFRIVFPEEVKP